MTDYKTFFGLSNDPFAAIASGSNVFVTPEVDATIAALKKALATEDAIVAVTGPVGSGKTTIARYVLENVAKFHIIVTIGRIQFGHDEVLELLLAGLGVRQLPKSTVHRFAMFRRVLQQYAEQQSRVFILVEDATRVGYDALSELEAVTAADAGVSGGANLVLLGDQGLNEMVREPRYARIKQRIRARQKIEAQNANELHDYLQHCFRLAGKDFAAIFEDDCCAALHRLSDGIPRMANNLVKATLSAAAEQGLSQIEVSLIERVANDEFGLTGDHKVTDIQAEFDRVAADVAIPELAPHAELAAEPEPESEPEPEPEPEPELAAQADITVESSPAPKPQPPDPVDAGTEPIADPASKADNEVPALIQDTLPDLQVLTPRLMPDDELVGDSDAGTNPPADLVAEATDQPSEFDLPILTGVFPASAVVEQETAEAPAPKSAFELPELVDAEPLPEPVAAPKSEPEQEPEPAVATTAEPDVQPSATDTTTATDDSEEVPEWERDPTLAQLRPDLDALERAMAVAKGADDDEAASVLEENLAQQGVAPGPEATNTESQDIDIVPEITLDKQIQAKIEEATEALKQTHVDTTDAQGTDTPDTPDTADTAELKTNSGGAAAATAVTTKKPVARATPPVETPAADTTRADQELEKIAGELAKAKTIEDVDDELAETLFGEEFSMIAAQVAANAPSIGDETEVASGTPAGEVMGSMALSLEEDDAAAVPAAAQSNPHNTSSSRRLQVLRDLNHTVPPPGAPPNPGTTESIVMSSNGVDLPPARHGSPVESIEDQINTSMTQTLKALNIDQVALNDDDDDDDDDETGRKKSLFGFLRRK